MKPATSNPTELSNLVQQNAHAVQNVDRRLRAIQSRLDALRPYPEPSQVGPTAGGDTFSVMPGLGARTSDAYDVAETIGRRAARRIPGDPDGPSGGDVRRPLPVDLLEDETEFVLRADLPGVDAPDVDIRVSPDKIVVQASRQPEQDGTILVGERIPTHYQRSVRLPAEIDVDEVEATFENGRLTVALPKVDPSASSRRINID